MSYLKEYFEDGLANPYMFTSDEDALFDTLNARQYVLSVNCSVN